MKNILAKGGVEFLAVFLGIALSLWVDEYQKTNTARELNYKILSRLYDNLGADSTDIIWNIKAHKTSINGSNKVSSWCKDQQPVLDSIDIFLSSMGIITFFVNNMEEYNSLKASGRMELLEDASLVKNMHQYYTHVEWVKGLETMQRDYVTEQFIPFMSQYSDGYEVDEKRNVYDNSYALFQLHRNPSSKKLNYHAGVIKTYTGFCHLIYTNLLNRVSELRRMIKKELNNV